MAVAMAAKKTTKKQKDPESRVVRSVGFPVEHYPAVKEKAAKLGLPVSTFISTAALKAAGVDTSAKAKQLAKSLAAV